MSKLLAIAAVLAASASSSWAGVCTSSQSLGSLTPPDLGVIGNTFGSTQSFNDCYSFTLGSGTDLWGLNLEWDFSLLRDIDLGSVTLSGGSLLGALTDTTPGTFAVDGLGAGSYLLEVAGMVTGRNGGLFGGGLVGYSGTVTTTTAPIPEPETYALMLLGLAAVGGAARLRRGREAAAAAAA